MILGFVESPRRKRPNPQNPDPKATFVFWVGFLIILGFAASLLPFGAYLPFSVSVWALVILFLPLLFFGIFLISKLGYVILISVFLSLLGGGLSILFLGDYFGYMTKTTVATEISPENVTKYSEFKFIFLKDFQLKVDEEGSFQAPIVVRNRGGAKHYGPNLQFRFVPIRSKSDPNRDLSLYALCMSAIGSGCLFSEFAKGGNVMKESVWDSDPKNRVGISPVSGALYLLWKPWGEDEIKTKGVWSLGSLGFLILIWAGFAFRKKLLPFSEEI